MSAYCKKEFLSDRNLKELPVLYGHISIKNTNTSLYYGEECIKIMKDITFSTNFVFLL